jgi:hypothetical protein
MSELGHLRLFWLRPAHSRFTPNCGLIKHDAGTEQTIRRGLGGTIRACAAFGEYASFQSKLTEYSPAGQAGNPP